MGQDATPKFTVEEALLSVGFGKYQLLVLAYAGMGWISEAMETMLLSFIGPAVQAFWNLSSEQESLITSVVFVGMLVGAYFWGLVSDKHGRKSGFLITAAVTGGAGILSALAPNYGSLISLRCLVGLGVGGAHVLSSWFLEFIPAPSRGTWMMVFSAFWTVGTISEASLAWLIMPNLGWRWLLVLSSVPSSLLLIFYGMVPESPRYLCLKGRNAEALAVLEKAAKVNGRELPPGILVSEHEIGPSEQDNPSESTKLLPDTTSTGASSKTTIPTAGSITSVLMLLSPDLLMSSLLLWLEFFGIAFTYYGVVLLTTELSTGQDECIPNQLHSQNSNVVNYRDVFIASFAEFPGLLLSTTMVDKLGRKFSMSSMLFLCFAFLFPLAFPQSQRLTTTLLFGARVCITASFSIIYIYASEIYPTSVRSTGTGVGSAVGRIGGMVCPLVAINLVHECHQTASIVVFEVVTFVSAFCVLLFPLETSGRKLSDRLDYPSPDI